MSLRDRGELLLLAGDYEQAIPLLERSAARNQKDDFASDLMPVVQSLVLLGRCVEAEELTVAMKSRSFAPTSEHAVWTGWARWFQGDHNGGVRHFLEAARCPYQNFGWGLALYCSAVWDPACYSMSDAQSSLRAAEKKLPRDFQMILCIWLASGGISESEFLTGMCERKFRFRRRWNATHRAIAHFWIALRHWRDPDPTAMLPVTVRFQGDAASSVREPLLVRTSPVATVRSRPVWYTASG